MEIWENPRHKRKRVFRLMQRLKKTPEYKNMSLDYIELGIYQYLNRESELEKIVIEAETRN